MANSMRARTVFVILLVLILLVAFGSALVAVGSQEIAALVFGCEVNLNYAVPCVIGGKDYGQTFYDLGFAIWYSYLTIPSFFLSCGRLQPQSCFWAGSPSAGARRRKLSFASC
jgi:hypothetical protein